jgi:hypothetical protein
MPAEIALMSLLDGMEGQVRLEGWTCLPYDPRCLALPRPSSCVSMSGHKPLRPKHPTSSSPVPVTKQS